jgi:hypothetical protein
MTERLPRLNGLMSVFVRERDRPRRVCTGREGAVGVRAARHTTEWVVFDRDARAVGTRERISLEDNTAFAIVLGDRLHPRTVLRQRRPTEAVDGCRRRSRAASFTHPTSFTVVVVGGDWIRSARWTSRGDARKIVVLICRRSTTDGLGCDCPVRIDHPSKGRQRR